MGGKFIVAFPFPEQSAVFFAKQNLGSSVFPADRVAFSRSLWGLGACFRASGIGARCVFEHAAVSAFQAFLAKLPPKGPLRSTFPD